MRPSDRYAWPKDSARPYESLWAIFHRFVYLNRPGYTDLGKVFGIGGYLREFSLLYGNRVNPKWHSDIFLLEKFRRVLGIPNKIFNTATLAFIQDTVLDQIYTELRFCPQCLENGYHSVVFQFREIRECLIHGVELENKCPKCGSAIPTMFESYPVMHPFSCPNCKQSLLSSNRVILNPTPMDTSRIKPVMEWLQSLSSLDIMTSRKDPRASWDATHQLEWVFPCLEQIAGGGAPNPFSEMRSRISNCTKISFACGFSPSHSLVMRTKPVKINFADGQYQRHVTIYKAYRRHLEKKLLRAKKWRMLKLCANVVDLFGDEATGPNKHLVAGAYAILLFREDMEGWDSLRRFFGPHIPRYNIPFYFHSGNRYVSIKGLTGFLGSDEEIQWAKDHFFMMEIQALFEEALGLSRRMNEIDGYWDGKQVIKGLTLPFSVVMREPTTNKLKCFSWNMDAKFCQHWLSREVDDWARVERKRLALLD